jgi:hypothetical protein
MKHSSVCEGLLVVLVALIIVNAAVASPATRKTRITFSQSVRVPGTTLSAGTYVFEAPHTNNRTTVKISDENGKLVTQIMGIADYTRKQDHDIIVFGDHDCGPKAIKSWFYPGSGTGVRFVYPKNEAEMIASECDEPVPEMHEKTPGAAPAASDQVYLMTPGKQEEEYTPEALATSDQMDKNGFNAAAAQQPSGNSGPPQ